MLCDVTKVVDPLLEVHILYVCVTNVTVMSLGDVSTPFTVYSSVSYISIKSHTTNEKLVIKNI